MEYKEEDFLQLSGIQHFKFCRRQWALIHIENQWAENFRTVDGEILHKNAHDKGFRESRGEVLITRGMHVFSASMGVSGECDVLEFHRDETGIPLKDREGLWRPYPVEYKRGEPNERSGDTLQLCAQALCLEEMLCCDIPEGALYYGEIRHRMVVSFTPQLRDQVRVMFEEMHAFYQRGYTPKGKRSRACNACSLKDLCLPGLMHTRPVADYVRESLEDIG